MGLSWHAVTTLDTRYPLEELAHRWAADARVSTSTAKRWLSTARRLDLLAEEPLEPLERLASSAWVRLTRNLTQLERVLDPQDSHGVLAQLGLEFVGDRTAAISLGRRLLQHHPTEELVRPSVLLELVLLRRESTDRLVEGHDLFALWRSALGTGDTDSKSFGQDCLELHRRGLLDVRWAQYPREGVLAERQVATRLGYVGAVAPRGRTHSKPIPTTGTGRS